jgi:hypothetical protein
MNAGRLRTPRDARGTVWLGKTRNGWVQKYIKITKNFSVKLNSLNLGLNKNKNNAVNAPASSRTKNIPAEAQAVWRKRGSNRLKIQFCFFNVNATFSSQNERFTVLNALN